MSWTELEQKIIDLHELFPDALNWEKLSEQEWSLDFLDRFKQQINWIKISMDGKLSVELLSRFPNLVSWYWVSQNSSLTFEMIQVFSDVICWRDLLTTESRTLSDDELIILMPHWGSRLVADSEYTYRWGGPTGPKAQFSPRVLEVLKMYRLLA